MINVCLVVSVCLVHCIYWRIVLLLHISSSGVVWLMRGAPKCSSGVVRGGPKLVMGFQLLLLSCVILALLFLGAIKGIFVGNVSSVLGTSQDQFAVCLTGHIHTYLLGTSQDQFAVCLTGHIHTYLLGTSQDQFAVSLTGHIHTYLQLSHTCTYTHT